MPLYNNSSSVSGGGLVSTTAYASAAALGAAFPAADNSGKLGLVGSVLYTSNGTAWTATGGVSSSRLVPEVSIFQAELRNSTAPITPDGANVTVTFTRNFSLTALQANGTWADVAHNTPGYQWIPGAGRSMLAGAGGVTGILWAGTNEQRDLTQANWVKTNCTAAKNVTGLDGTANSASSVTATAALATVLYPTTAGATGRTFQAWVSRRAGYGRVWMTVDGGTSWADITARVGATLSRVSLPTSAANPSCGFMLEYSGDAINFDSGSLTTNTYPMQPTLGRGDVAGQTLSIVGARKTTANPALSLEFNWWYDDTPAGSVQLSNAGAVPLINVLQSATNPAPAVQLVTSAGTQYPGIPSLYVGSKKTNPGQVHKYKFVFVGQTIYTYLDREFVGIYDTTTPLAGLTPANFKDLYLTPNNGNAVSDVNISDWLGRVVVGLGDSITVIESYRQGWLKALPPDSVFLQRGVAGNTVAMVRDRIAADLALSLPSGNTCYVVLWCGTNSLANNATPAATLAELQTAINNILAINANAKIILPTTFRLRTGGLTGITAGQFATNADTYNAGLSSLTGVYKVVEMNDANSTAAGFFLADGIHPKGESYSQIVQKLAPWVLL